ncbi:MAG TPA: cbb3-type cytochrome oxidase assembly protein CcoS [Bosea sp. (in: a-proteobacteria)]|jgi:cbb3-type cytochrome oxidase maturation protein|nr:cbb3-type cytochrome oxidase assembly protein CcoS [Bosea sp. (in: a-proteobacteria)]
MNIIVILFPLALGLGLVGLGAFFWCMRSGQYADLDGAAWRVLQDDDAQSEPPSGVSGSAGNASG